MSKTCRSISAIIALSLLVLAACGSEGRSGPIRDMIAERRAARSANAPAPNTTEVAMSHGGVQRSFLVHVPPGFDPSRSYGAVLVFHGGMGSGARMEASSGMSQASDAHGDFIAVYPDAGGGQWDDGRATARSGRDDVGFIRAVLNELVTKWGVDPRRIFATGMSNGGMFVQRLACELPGGFAAFSVVAANMPAELAETCRPSAARPIVFFNGTADPVIPFEGGEIASSRLLRAGAGGQVISSDRTLDFWAAVNRCDSASARDLPDRARDDTEVVQVAYTGCDGGPVLQYRVVGGGHTWPGAASHRRSRITGPTTQDISATDEMLEFFRRHGL